MDHSDDEGILFQLAAFDHFFAGLPEAMDDERVMASEFALLKKDVCSQPIPAALSELYDQIGFSIGLLDAMPYSRLLDERPDLDFRGKLQLLQELYKTIRLEPEYPVVKGCPFRRVTRMITIKGEEWEVDHYVQNGWQIAYKLKGGSRYVLGRLTWIGGAYDEWYQDITQEEFDQFQPSDSEDYA